MKLAFFGYAWGRPFRPDVYMTETVDSLAQAGVDVDLYLGSQLSKEYGIYGLSEAVSPDKLASFIAAEGYDAAISFNNSMLIPEIMGALKGPIATVIVDEPEHLFDYRGDGPYDIFRRNVEIVAMSSALERRLIAAVEGVRPRLHFMLPATHIEPRDPAAAPAYPISWIASYVGDLNLDLYLKLVVDMPEYRALTIRCLDTLERGGQLSSIVEEGGADAGLIQSLPWSLPYFQTQMQNILTNRGRVAVVERLSRHGLALFGNAGWRPLIAYNAAVLTALQAGQAPAVHADLRRVYNASRISINLPQVHVAPSAVQYRVIDVMASGALMITQRSENSDLNRVFGDDCPVPTYADLDELEALCVHYLTHEDERLARVAACNRLVARGFSFAERAVELLHIVGIAPTANGVPGQLRWIDLDVVAAA